MEKMSFYQWLNAYESITRREWMTVISEEKRDYYKRQYEDYLKDNSYV